MAERVRLLHHGRMLEKFLGTTPPIELEVLLLAIGDGDSGRPIDSGSRLANLVGRLDDWQGLVALANRHRVLPLLCQGLQDKCWPGVPGAIQQNLQRASSANLKRNFRLAHHAAGLLRAFHDTRIRVIPFKGVFLAHSAYGQLSSRQVNDIDLIIHPRDRWVASRVLESLGYDSVERLDQQEVFRNSCVQTEVDLHWDIAPGFFPVPFDFEQVHRRARPTPFAGTSFTDLSLQDQLLLLSAQLGKDCWERKQKIIHLQKLCDLARVITLLDADDLESVVRLSREQGLSRVLDFSLILVTGLLSLRLPDRLQRQLQADTVAHRLARGAASLPELAWTELPPEGNPLFAVGLRWRQLRFYMGLRESWKHRALYLTRIARVVGTGATARRGQRMTAEAIRRMQAHQLLVAAAADDPGDAARHWELWQASHDLDAVGAESYWILPAVFANLSKQPAKGPDHRRLAGVYKQTRLRNAALQGYLAPLLAGFRQAACEVMIGPPASMVLDGTMPGLPLQPVLLVVRAAQVGLANEVLCAGGWHTARSVPPDELKAFVESIEYTNAGGGRIELCWRPLGTAAPPGRESPLWERRVPGRVAEVAIQLPCPLDQALMILQRGTRVQRSLLTRWPTVDWRALEERAQAMGLDPESVGQGLEADPGAQARPVALLRWHRQRFRSCPAQYRPGSFLRYLRLYHTWAWQPQGTWSGLVRTIGRRFSG